MNGKAWYQSKACIGGCVAAIIGIISMFTAIGPALEKEQGAITDGLVGLAEIFAGAMAIYGRIVATKQIGGPRGSKLYGWIILIVLIPCVAGCVQVHVEKEMPDGTKIYATYERWFAPQELEGVQIDLDTGKACIVKQKSDTVVMVAGIAEGIARGLK